MDVLTKFSLKLSEVYYLFHKTIKFHKVLVKIKKRLCKKSDNLSADS